MSSNSETKNPSNNQETGNNKNPVKSEAVNQEELTTWTTKVKAFFSSWKFKLAIIVVFILFLSYVIFYWQHIMAVQGMKMWASHANATPIDCMMKDSNGDDYISCTAKLDDQVVPLECGTSLFNLGCRVNYGTASPSIRNNQKAVKF